MAAKAAEIKQSEVSATPALRLSETLKMAIYGEWGRRKTEQLGVLIESVGMENVFIASCDRGLSTIESVVDFNRVMAVDSWADMQAAFGKAEELCGNNPTKWALVDGCTSLLYDHTNSLFAGTERAYDAKAFRQPIPDRDITYGRYLSREDKIDGMAIYGRVGRDFTRLFQSWKGLGCNIIFTFLEELAGKTDKREKTYPYGPLIPGEVGYRAAMSTFDYVLRFWYDTDGSLIAGTKATSLYEARTREDRRGGVEIPAQIRNFNLAEFINLIQPVRRTQPVQQP